LEDKKLEEMRAMMQSTTSSLARTDEKARRDGHKLAPLNARHRAGAELEAMRSATASPMDVGAEAKPRLAPLGSKKPSLLPALGT
jgi:hypothetical protein